jgi:DNA-binding GntR family transcriptional regulator
MPKQNKDAKGKRQKSGAVADQTDDDFDDMLAEFCAADLASATASGSTTTTSASSSSSSNNPTPAARATTRRATTRRAAVPEATIIRACVAGDVGLLRQWARRDIRAASAEPLWVAAAGGKLDVVRLLLKELGADRRERIASWFDGFVRRCR